MNKIQQYIDHKTITCIKCELHKLFINNNNYYYMGNGKLLSKPGKISNEIFVIGLNPSHIRWPGLIYSFGGGYDSNCLQENNNAGLKFFKILENLNVLDKCYITNIAKCSTINNQISNECLSDCFEQILRIEIETHQPKLIMAAGKQTYNFLKLKQYENLEYITHPSYYFSYNKGDAEQYKNEISEILTRYKI